MMILLNKLPAFFVFRLLFTKKNELMTLSEHLSQILEKCNQYKQRVKDIQQKRQEDMWKFIKLAVSTFIL